MFKRMVLCLPAYCSADHFEGTTLATVWTPRWWHTWRAETCSRLAKVWCVYILVHV